MLQTKMLNIINNKQYFNFRLECFNSKKMMLGNKKLSVQIAMKD